MMKHETNINANQNEVSKQTMRRQDDFETSIASGLKQQKKSGYKQAGPYS
jgi:hypothetical protein